MLKILYETDNGYDQQIICSHKTKCHNCNELRHVLLFESTNNDFITMSFCKECLMEMFEKGEF